MVFRKPEPTDKMEDHAEQHSHAFDEISNLKDSVDNHSHKEYISSVEDTFIRPTADNRFITLTNVRPAEEDGSYKDEEFGLKVNIDQNNSFKNQFQVGNRNGFALKVTGGTGLQTWFGGKVVQKGSSLENKDARDYIIRKNLNDAVDPLVEQVEHNEDRINALEAELEAVAETKAAGEWKLVSTIAKAGDMSLSDTDLTTANNTLTLHQTDLNGVSHGFSGVEVGDLVEVLEEHEVMSRSTGDFALYEVTGVNGNSFTLELQQGRGIAELNKRFYVKFFHLSEDVNIAELDARYAQKTHSHSYASTNHTHSSVPSHTHNYASDTHTHSYASTSHTHNYASSSHSHSTIFKNGTSTNPSLSKGEPYLNTSQKVVYVGL
jgi:hypothetical protein